MEISAQLSLSICHAAESSRSASHDGCFDDADRHRKSSRHARSHKSSSGPAHKLAAHNCHPHRMMDAAADVQLNHSSNRRRIFAAFESIDLSRASVHMSDEDCRF